MAGIIGLISCMMCAVPFLIVSVYNKESKEPINFWSGDKSLKTKVKNVKEYNREMALLYKKCAITFFVTGVLFLVLPIAGVFMICFECTAGIYLVYRKYKNILQLHS